jgi:hypothetical protein
VKCASRGKLRELGVIGRPKTPHMAVALPCKATLESPSEGLESSTYWFEELGLGVFGDPCSQ